MMRTTELDLTHGPLFVTIRVVEVTVQTPDTQPLERRGTAQQQPQQLGVQRTRSGEVCQLGGGGAQQLFPPHCRGALQAECL